MILAVAQMVSGLGRAKELIAEARESGARAIVFPELFPTGYSLDLEYLYEQAKNTESAIDELVRLSDGMLIVCGMPERDERVKGVLYDSAFAIENGRVTGKYRKTHVFPAERSVFREGDSLDVFDSGIGRIAMAICFDHAFPELFRIYALKGAELIFIPSAVPKGYEHLLELRTKARAQDNQIFVVGCNMCGSGFCGRSLVVDPKGKVVAQAGEGEELLLCEIDLSAVEEERLSEPVFRCRRDDLYVREMRRCLEL